VKIIYRPARKISSLLHNSAAQSLRTGL